MYFWIFFKISVLRGKEYAWSYRRVYCHILDNTSCFLLKKKFSVLNYVNKYKKVE